MKINLTTIIPSIVAVGSTNPVKVEAVKHLFQEHSTKAITVLSAAVNSGIADQPRSDKETRQGAINRSRQILKHYPQAEWGIGFEGGVRKITYLRQGKKIQELIEVAWVAISTRKGELALGGGVEFQLPPIITQKIEAGGELGPIMDSLTGEKDLKKREGAIGILSHHLLTRQEIYEQLLKLALVKFISLHHLPSWWKE